MAAPSRRSSSGSAAWLARGRERLDQAVEKFLTVVEALDADALVTPVRAVVVNVGEEAGDAVHGDAGLPEGLAVGRARAHQRDDGHARPHLRGDALYLRDDFRVERRRLALRRGRCAVRVVRADHRDTDLRVGEDAFERGLRVGGSLLRQYPAVDVGARRLRQGVVGVARFEPRGDAGRPHHGVVEGSLREPRRRARVRARRAHERAHVRRSLPRLDRGHALEVGARRLVKVNGEVKLGETFETRGQRVDGVVLDGQGAVPALVLHLQREVARHLLGGLHAVEEGTPATLAPAAALVDAELGVQEVAVVRDEPGRAVEVAALLVRRQRDDDVAVWAEALLLVAYEVGDEDRGHRLVVNRAAPVEVAVALRELERIEVGRPVLPLRLDHVEVRQQEDGPTRARAAQPRDDVAFARVAGMDEHLHVLGGEARRAQTRRHLLRGLGRVAHGVGRVRLDQFLVDVEEKLLIRLQGNGLRADASRGYRRRGEGEQKDSYCEGRRANLVHETSAVEPSSFGFENASADQSLALAERVSAARPFGLSFLMLYSFGVQVCRRRGGSSKGRRGRLRNSVFCQKG